MENFEHGHTGNRFAEHIISRGKGNDFMRLTFEELCEKEVVNITDGTSFGFVGDVVMDTETREAFAIVIKGRPKFFGFLGREEDIIIGWEKINTVGKDIILVKTELSGKINNEKENIFQKFFSFFLC